MIVQITQDDINRAKEASRKFREHEVFHYSRSETCPLAFALNRLYNGTLKLIHIRVMPWCIYIDSRRIDLSKELQDMIREIDNKKDRIRPRELELPL